VTNDAIFLYLLGRNKGYRNELPLSNHVYQKGVKLDYNVYEFKLHPGKYKANLITAESSRFMKEIVFWKDHAKWKVQLH
jgi:hypothetical protein